MLTLLRSGLQVGRDIYCAMEKRQPVRPAGVSRRQSGKYARLTIGRANLNILVLLCLLDGSLLEGF
jgi:hypothetical protein